MKRAEIELRKELALARLLIARMELALARTRPPSSVATVSSALDLASSRLATKSCAKRNGANPRASCWVSCTRCWAAPR